MEKYILTIANLTIATFIGFTLLQTKSSQDKLWTVEKVFDGDTIEVTRINDRRRIRLCGIDAPEKDQPKGEESKNLLTKLLENQKIAINFVEQDRYDRWIGEIFIDSKETKIFVNEIMVAQGMAWPYKKYWHNCPNQNAIAAAELRANNAIWKLPESIPPWEWRQQKRMK